VQERDKAISIFGQHVSPQVAEKLLNQPAESVGEEKDVCIMFLDIRDFSKIAAQKTPSEVMEYLNTLFSFMIEVVNEHNGIVNKFLGDGFMAVFGAPVEDASPGDNALRSSREILRRVEELNESKAIPPTRLGIGLHLGRAITGSVGSDERKEYTIIGDAVNLAARIEQATKKFKAMLLVSEGLWSAVDHDAYQAKDLGLVELKGQSQATRLYQID
jgi:adenylate cyclase